MMKMTGVTLRIVGHVLPGLSSQCLLILVHKFVSAVAAYGMRNAVFILQIICKKFFPAKMFAAP